MSTLQHFLDLGVTVGLLGLQHARTFEGDPQGGDFERGLFVIRSFTNHDSVALLNPDNSGRVVIARFNQLHYLRRHDYYFPEPASCVLIETDSLDAGVRTLCMPTCDHPFMSVQFERENKLFALGAARLWPGNLCGAGSIVEQLFEYAEKNHVDHVRFILSAGAGPCCIKPDPAYITRVIDAFGKDWPAQHFLRARPGSISLGMDLLLVITAEIERCKKRSKLLVNINPGDISCSACANHGKGHLYNSNGDGTNLAFFNSTAEIPPQMC